MKIFLLLVSLNLILVLSYPYRIIIKKNLNQESKDIKSGTSSTIGSDSASDIVLLGFDGFEKTTSLISFNTYVMYKNFKTIPKNIDFQVNINYNSTLRLLDEQTVNCSNTSDDLTNLEIIKYFCQANVKSLDFSNVELISKELVLNNVPNKLTFSSLATATKNNINNEEGNKISTSTNDFGILKKAEIVNNTPNKYEIKGYLEDDTGFISKNIKLISSKNGVIKVLPCQGKERQNKDDNNNYILECISNETLNLDLDNSFYSLEGENNENKNLLVQLAPGKTTSPKVAYNFYSKMKRKKGGLSTGGIIAIIIPCIIVLIGVMALIYFLRKHQFSPSKDANQNVTVGITSSESVVAK